MKRVITVLVLLATALLVLPIQARAGSSTDAALALGAFAVFNQIVRGETIFNGVGGAPQVVREIVVVQQPAAIYAPSPPVVIYPSTPPPLVVVYPPTGYYHPPYPYAQPGCWPPGHCKNFYKKHWKHHHDDDDD